MEIILLLDANEKWGPQSQIKKIANNLQLYNVLGDEQTAGNITHPCITNPERGTTIDSCLVSKTTVNHIIYVILTPYDLHTLGDHRGIIIDIDIITLLNVINDNLSIASGRKLCSDDSTSEKRYLKKVTNSFQKQNIYKRAKKLMYQTATYQKNQQQLCKEMSLWNMKYIISAKRRNRIVNEQ